MRKFLLIGQFPPPRHGVSVINEILSEELQEYYDVDCYDYRFSYGLKDIGSANSFKKIVMYLKHLVVLLFKVLINRYDYIYFTPNVRGGVFYRDLLVVMLLKISFSDIFLHLHGLGIKDNMPKKHWRFFYKIMFSGNHILHVSKKVLDEEFSECEFGEKSLSYLNNSVNLDVADRICKSGNPDHKVVVHMSNFRPSKGVMDVLKTYQGLKKVLPSCELIMIGSFTSDSFEAEVKHYIKSNGLEDICFTGFLDAKSKISHLSCADLFLYPSYDDSFGLVVLEAQALGLPVVCYDIGSMLQIVNPKTGVVCEVGRSECLLESSQDILLSDSEKTLDWEFLREYDVTTYTARLVEIMERNCEG